MRDLGIPKLLTWRWAPCAALVLGSLSFVGFVSLVVPEHIGGLVDSAGKGSSLRLGNSLARSRTTQPDSPVDNSGESEGTTAAAPAPSPVTRIAQRSGDNYPRRGFSPPLDRPPEPPAPPPAAFTAPVPPPAEAAPPPPAPAPPPAQEAPAPQADVAQATPAPAPGTPPAQ